MNTLTQSCDIVESDHLIVYPSEPYLHIEVQENLEWSVVYLSIDKVIELRDFLNQYISEYSGE